MLDRTAATIFVAATKISNGRIAAWNRAWPFAQPYKCLAPNLIGFVNIIELALATRLNEIAIQSKRRISDPVTDRRAKER